MLDKYIKKFGRLHTDKNKKRWNQRTTFRAPHKPLLLLSVLDRFSEGAIQTNLVEFDGELVELFNIYWHIVKPPSQRGVIGYPLWHLQSDGFWQLLPRPGYEERIQHGAITSIKQLHTAVFGASLDEDLFQLMQQEESRNLLRTVLIETYFDQELQPKLAEQGIINQQAFQYSRQLLSQVKQKKTKETAEEAYQRESRDQGFRRAITAVYDHRCALCGIRMLTPEGHTVVDAAHIIPWRISHNDDPRNGLALCRLCHWTYDEGMLAVSTDYMVNASPRLRADPNLPAHLAALDGRSMMRPTDADYWPAAKSLDWHVNNVFRHR